MKPVSGVTGESDQSSFLIPCTFIILYYTAYIHVAMQEGASMWYIFHIAQYKPNMTLNMTYQYLGLAAAKQSATTDVAIY